MKQKSKLVEHRDSNNLLHKENGPAVIYDNIYFAWYYKGSLHRSNGPAIVDKKSNISSWWCNGKKHREGGPAVETSDFNKWFMHGKLHRIDGPALEIFNKSSQYWIDGIQYSFEEWKKIKNLAWIL